MKFDAWREIREVIVAKHPDVLRLDCMNPFRAMDHFAAPCVVDAANKPTDADCELTKLNKDLLAAWYKSTGVRLNGTPVPTLGIRSFLAAFFESFSSEDRRVWLPRDVYPTYRVIAESKGWTVDEFEILPTPNWDEQVTPDGPKVAVLPIPLSPLGRDLQLHEMEFWQQWLAGDSQRILILDTVYAYQPDQLLSLAALIGKRTITAFSVSKAWLERCVFGFAEVNDALKSEFAGGEFPEIVLSQEEITKQRSLLKLMHEQCDLPVRQNNRFAEQWKKQEPAILEVVSDWSIPSTGYFSILNVDYEQLYQAHGILAVPATVFGSRHKALSVISCLYDIKADDTESC